MAFDQDHGDVAVIATPDGIRSGKRWRSPQRRAEMRGGMRPGQGERDEGYRHDEGDQQRQMNRIDGRQCGGGQSGKGAGHVPPVRAIGMSRRMVGTRLAHRAVIGHRHAMMRCRRNLGHRSAAGAQDDRGVTLDGADHVTRRHDELEQKRRRAEQHGEMALREQASDRRHKGRLRTGARLVTRTDGLTPAFPPSRRLWSLP